VLIVMDSNATPEMLAAVCRDITDMGLIAQPVPGTQRTAIAVTGNTARVDAGHIRMLPGVMEVVHVTKPYKLAGRESHRDNTIVEIDNVRIGGPELTVIAGPCSVESHDQCFAIAERLAESGVRLFRGGAYKPRTSPYSFQGLREEGLRILADVRRQFDLRIVTEAVDTETIDLVASMADVIQIGARNMQNYSLLKRAGRQPKPVLLKRGAAASIDELLLAAEYILAEGNSRVILCERGVRTYADRSPIALDLAAIPAVKANSHLPIIADPSHGTGHRDRVMPLARAAIAAGADGLMVEVHNNPSAALSDSLQAVTPDMFDKLMNDLRALAPIVNRTCV
jgi:3-deoxy-7-phosphoheptulonate synthase